LAVLEAFLLVLLFALLWVAALQRVIRPRRRRALLVIPPRTSDQTTDWIAVFVLIAPFVLVIDWIGDLFGS
jgi:hypothetical protein